jgi:hypothetical protein
MTRKNEESHDRAVRAFLEEHPEWHKDIRWECIPGEHEPQAMLRPKVMEAFIWWAYEQGMVGKPQRIPALLDLMSGVERDSEPHRTGLCNPDTCVYCGPNPRQ